MEKITVAIYQRAHMGYYENNKKQNKGACLWNPEQDCLWEHDKTRYSVSIAAFPTPSTVCRHDGFWATHLFFGADGRNEQKVHETTWWWFTKIQSSPLRFLFASICGGRETACFDHANTLSTFRLLFSATAPWEEFYTTRETFAPQRLAPPGMLQRKHLSHCSIWSIILVSTQPSIVIPALFCSGKTTHKPAPQSQLAGRCCADPALLWDAPARVPSAALHAWGQERDTVERKIVYDEATNIQMKSYKEAW